MGAAGWACSHMDCVDGQILGLAIATLMTTGCIGTGTGQDEGNGVEPALAGNPTAGPLPEETVAAWSGRMVVSGAYELPAHFPETAPLVEPVWAEGMRTFEVTEAPASLAVRMDWTGAPGTQGPAHGGGPAAGMARSTCGRPLGRASSPPTRTSACASRPAPSSRVPGR